MYLFIQPNNIADVDGKYIGSNRKVSHSSDGKHYSTLSQWDTFRAAFPMDTVKPTMSLIGNATEFTEINKPYVEPGVVATDNIEGNISAKFETIGMVDISKVGPNQLKYIVRDLYGNVSDTLYRNVFVIINQTGPSLVLDSPTTVYVEVYNKFTGPGFTARDNQGNLINNQTWLS